MNAKETIQQALEILQSTLGIPGMRLSVVIEKLPEKNATFAGIVASIPKEPTMVLVTSMYEQPLIGLVLPDNSEDAVLKLLLLELISSGAALSYQLARVGAKEVGSKTYDAYFKED